MKFLLVGNQAREHALAWKLSSSDLCTEIFVSPGNVGCERESKTRNVSFANSQDLLTFAAKENIDCVVIGSTSYMADGLVDLFQQNGIRVIGAPKLAAQLESSKSFARDFMLRHQVKTPGTASFMTMDDATTYLQACAFPIVIKYDGLGSSHEQTVIAMDYAEAEAAVSRIYLRDPQAKVLIQQYIAGWDLTYTLAIDGTNTVLMPTCLDYKKLKEGDVGINTASMGAYAPVLLSEEVRARITIDIVDPTLEGMRQEGLMYAGFLYFGIRIADDGQLFLLEYNCRLGDPEGECLTMLLQSDASEFLQAIACGKLNEISIAWHSDVVVGVYNVPPGYPANPQKGIAITAIPDHTETCSIFFAGIGSTEQGYITGEGRTALVIGRGKDIESARNQAYLETEKIQYEGKIYRKDIGDLNNNNRSLLN